MSDPTVVEDGDEPVVRLARYDGPWPADDPDANFKVDVAAYANLDPLATLRQLARNVDVPVGALARYVLSRWTSGGSDALLELGPDTVRRMQQACAEAETDGSDAARLRAYAQLREMVGWLATAL